MGDTIPRFPLEWPPGWKRTPAGLRQASAFHKVRAVDAGGGSTYKSKERLDIADGLARLEGELRRLGAQSVVISSNLEVNAGGRPYTKQSKMLADPGVAVYFKLAGAPRVLACDQWKSTAENMAAVAGHIEAIRACERYGVGSIAQAFAGYKALPADSALNWRAVFGFSAGARPSRDELEREYKKAARVQHPDLGGSDIAMAHLNRARAYALEELGG